MSTKTVVKDIIDAIHNVRWRVRLAMRNGDLPLAHKLMGDIYALEVCLVTETDKLIREIEATEAYKEVA